jgi:hypothetical protein
MNTRLGISPDLVSSLRLFSHPCQVALVNVDNLLRVVGKNLEREGVSNVFGESHESS